MCRCGCGETFTPTRDWNIYKKDEYGRSHADRASRAVRLSSAEQGAVQTHRQARDFKAALEWIEVRLRGPDDRTRDELIDEVLEHIEGVL